MHTPSARQTRQQPLEVFTIVGSDGESWRALRQHLGKGVYRTPDDPTTLEDLIRRLQEQDLQKQIAEELRGPVSRS